MGSELEDSFCRPSLSLGRFFKAVCGFSFSPSTTRCFTALAPIPTLDTAQRGPEIRPAARNSQTRDFGEQGRGGLCSVLFLYVGTVHLGCLLQLASLHIHGLGYYCGFVRHYVCVL